MTLEGTFEVLGSEPLGAAERLREYWFPREPLRTAPTGNLPALSRGLAARAAARASAIGRVVDMADTAYRLYNMSQQLAYGSNPAIPEGDQCDGGGGEKQWGMRDAPELHKCSSTQPGDIVCFPPGMDFWPVGPINRIVSLTAQGINGNPNCWLKAGERMVPEGEYKNPNRALPYPEGLPLGWTDFPETRPIMKPTGFPGALPYSGLPGRPPSPYRNAGPLPGEASGVPPPLDPGQVKLDDGHMEPMLDVRERKWAFNRAVWAAISVVTEADDAIECAWKALPKKERSAVKGRKYGGQTLYYWHPAWAAKNGKSPEATAAHNAKFASGRAVHQSPVTMVEELARHGIPSEKEIAAAAGCAALSHFVDMAIGKAASKTTAEFKAFQRRSGLRETWLHIGTGPAL